MEERVFKFKKVHDDGGIILEPIGRLYLCDGSCVKIMFSPEGVRIFIPEKAIKNKSAVTMKMDDPFLTTMDLGNVKTKGK